MLWANFIHPDTILEQVRNTAPFLALPAAEAGRVIRATGGFPGILAAAGGLGTLAESLTREEQLEDYFALCLAAHHATVATFVPTDVDTKIRGLLWRETRERATLRAMADLAFEMPAWPLDGISRRWDAVNGSKPVSGHNGEWFSVMAGAHGRFLAVGDFEYADRTAEAIDAELRREAAVFLEALRRPGLEVVTLRLAMSITHNLGDLDQGISFWEGGGARAAESRVRFGRLAHDNTSAYGGALQIAARLYKENLAAEGHRHYPLRAVKPLRKSADLLLPLGPFLDDWGAAVAAHPALDHAERAEVLDALVKGCRKVAGQAGYYRAIAGFAEASTRNFEAVAERMPASSRKELRDPALRQRVAVPKRSFESALAKKVATARAASRDSWSGSAGRQD